MFDIFTNYTIEDCNELQTQVNELRNLYFDTESVKNNLSSLTQMERVIAAMNAVLRDMDEEYEVFRQFTQALDKINFYYLSTENRICDSTEQNVIRYQKRDLVSVDLKVLSGMLDSITLG